MADFAELAKGLLTLEINTVQKDGMSAQKMPTAPNALIEVAQAYWTFLCSKAQDFGIVGVPLAPLSANVSRSFDWGREPYPQATGTGDRPVQKPKSEPYPPGHNATFLQQPPDVANFLVFDHLREIAAWISEMQSRFSNLAGDPSGGLSGRLKLGSDELAEARRISKNFRPEERPVLHRIRRNSDQFKSILDRIDASVTGAGDAVYGERKLVIHRASDDTLFSAADLVAIRKAWDIGTEIVLMQTVIQIDGDVINRFQAGTDTPGRTQLHSMHASAVDLSFRYWRWLAEAMAELAGRAVSTLLR